MSITSIITILNSDDFTILFWFLLFKAYNIPIAFVH